MYTRRVPKKQPASIDPPLLNLDIANIVIPDQASLYYPLVDYFLTYSIAGEAISKKAEFIISGLKIDSDGEGGSEHGELISRKLDIKNKFVRMAIYYFAYGLSVLYPMPKVKKILECPICKYTKPLEDMHKAYKPEYRYTEEGVYYARCRNSLCKSGGTEQRMRLIEEEVPNIEDYNLAVWPPHSMTCIHNTVTDKKKWMYKCDDHLRELVSERDHFTICSTPENFLTSIMKDMRITIPGDRLYVMEYPTLTIKGVPIPPMVGAFQDLYQRQLYQRANRNIAKDIMVPLRMLFPIFKGESGNRPMVQTQNMQDWSTRVRSEVRKWSDDKSYVPIMPVEVGSKDIWGNGKMFALDDHLKANQQDVLAALGVPLEFIYGGATWSRQNVSAITLENVLKSFALKLREPLKFIEDKANRLKGKEDKIRIYLDTPRLVDSMMETSIIAQLEQQGKVSMHTMLKSIGKSYDDEMRSLEFESADTKRRIIEASKQMALAESEAEEISLRGEAKRRKVQRAEALKDSVSQRAIEKDHMMFQIELQKLQYAEQMKMQREQVRDQIEAQKEMAPIELGMMEAQLAINNEAQLQMAKKMQNLEALGIRKQIKAQYKAQQELEEAEQKKQEREIQQQAFDTMSDEEKQQLMQMPPEEQQQMIQQYVERAQMMQVFEQMPDEIKQEMADMDEEQKIQTIQEYGQHLQEEQASELDEEEEAKINSKIEAKKREHAAKEELDHENLVRAAKEYNRLDVYDRELFRRELIEEDTERFSKVKEMADQMAIQEYVGALLSTDDVSTKNAIWDNIAHKQPDLLNDVTEAMHEQMIQMREASKYATKLLEAKGNEEEYQQVVEEIKKNTDQGFRHAIIEEYKKLIGYTADQQEGGYESLSVQEAANYIANLDPESQQIALDDIRYNNPEMFSKINTILLQGQENE